MKSTETDHDAGELSSLPPPVAHELPDPGERYVPVNWKFFGLREAPFSLSLDPRFFFFGHQQEADLSQLVFGIGQRRGIMLVTGEAGAGKTIFCRALLEQFDDSVHGSMISGTGTGGEDLIRLVCRSRGLEVGEPGEGTDLEKLKAELLADFHKKKNAVIFIDDAQDLTVRQLEQVHHLGSLRAGLENVVQVILLGEPELIETLLLPVLGKLNRGIAVRVALRCFTLEETGNYVRHRLEVAAGGVAAEIFSPAALKALRRWSRGNPRLINILGDRAMHKACGAEEKTVDLPALGRARRDLGLEHRSLRPVFIAVGALAAAAALFWAGMGWIPRSGRSMPEASVEARTAAVPAETGESVELLDVEAPLEAKVSVEARTAKAPAKTEESMEARDVSAPAGTETLVEARDVEAPAVPEASMEARTVAPPAETGAAAKSLPPVPAGRHEDEVNDVVRVASAADSLKGSLSTLFGLWGMKDLAAECADWKVVNFNASLLGIFFRETGIFRRYGIELHPLDADLPFLRSVGLPFLFTYIRRDGAEGAEHYAVLARFREETAVVYDPLEGRVEIPLEEWRERVSGLVYYLYRDSHGFIPLAPGDKGPDVAFLQEELRQAGVYRGDADGVYGGETLRAIRDLQVRYGLDEDGVAGLRTRLVLMKEAGRFPPSS
jgi:general secretion pathway protein A